MFRRPREYTGRVIELAEEGVLCWEQIARDCMNYMSEDQVGDMAHSNGYFEHDLEDEDE